MKGFTTILIIAATVVSFEAWSQRSVNQVELKHFIDSTFRAGIEKKLIPGAAVVVVTSDSLLLKNVYGLAKIEGNVPVTDTTLFQVGSVGKLFTSIAVLQMVERGELDLDKDVNSYLTDFKIQNPYSVPVTLRHLLTHTAGFNERVIGYQAKTTADVVPLGLHLKDRMPGLFQTPGIEINYSNYGFALAGHLVELKSGKKYEQYIHDEILQPLGMRHATFFVPDDYTSNNQFANGYRLRDEFELMKVYPRNTVPAGGIVVSAADMPSFLQVFLKRDKLLTASGLQSLFEPQFKSHDILTGYSFGCEEQLYNGIRFFVKGGQVQGALAYCWFFPDFDLAVFYTVNTQTDNFSTSFAEGFKKKFLKGETGALQLSQDFEAMDVSVLKGGYRSNRHNRETIEDLVSLIMSFVQIDIGESGRITARLQGKFQEFEQIDRGVFQGLTDPNVKLVFGEVDGTMRLYADARVAGMTVPSSFMKVPYYETVRFIDKVYPWLLLPLMCYPVLLMWFGIIHLVRIRRKSFLQNMTLTMADHWPMVLFFVAVTIDVIFFLVPLIRNPFDLLFGLPDGFVRMKYLHWLMNGLLLFVAYRLFVVLKQSRGSWLSRIFYVLFVLSSIFYMYILWRWHFMSMAA